MRRRKVFKPNVPCHVYSRGFKSFCIFYDLQDFLVFISIYNFYARRYGIRTISLCVMANHYHCIVIAPSKLALSRFIQTVESVFAKQYNEAHKRSGPVFWHRFGWAHKEIAKKVRSSIAYVNNNPVAGKLCKSALEYRWNCLAYYSTSYPFSKKYLKSESSRRMRRAVDYFEIFSSGGMEFLGYPAVAQMFDGLSAEEVQQLADIVISRCNPLDYKEMISYFNTYDKAILSIESNTGDEHDLKEDWDDYSAYRKMIRVVRQNGCSGLLNFENIEDISEIGRLYGLLSATGANSRQIRKFLHISINRKDV